MYCLRWCLIRRERPIKGLQGPTHLNEIPISHPLVSMNWPIKTEGRIWIGGICYASYFPGATSRVENSAHIPPRLHLELTFDSLCIGRVRVRYERVRHSLRVTLLPLLYHVKITWRLIAFRCLAPCPSPALLTSPCLTFIFGGWMPYARSHRPRTRTRVSTHRRPGPSFRHRLRLCPRCRDPI